MTPFEALFLAATVTTLEDALLTMHSTYTLSVCVFLHLVQSKFLPMHLACGGELRSLRSYLEHMQGQCFAPLHNVSIDWAIRYALGGEVYTDLVDNNIAHSNLPTNFTQLRQLSPVVRTERHVVWSEAIRSTNGRPTAKSTQQASKVASCKRGRRIHTGPEHRSAPYVLRGTVIVSTSHDTLGTHPTTATVEHDVQPATASLPVIFSCTTVRYGTPPHLVRPSKQTLGGTIDLDPFSEICFNTVVGARKIITEEEDGLREINEWSGGVFMNPPGGTLNGQSMCGLAIARATAEYNLGNITACVAIVKVAVGYVWFQQVWQYALCFLHERPAFRAVDAPTGEDGRAPTGYVVVYIGPAVDMFIKAFKTLGHIVLPVRDCKNTSRVVI
jgi:hypothetical protein